MKRILKLNVNSEEKEILTEVNKTLLEVLREDLGLTGTKRGCDLGTCGACTVLIEGKPYLSCLTLAVDVEKKRLSPLKALLRKENLILFRKPLSKKGLFSADSAHPG